ncbi:MAG: AmmeMemoRadiSam system protein B [Bacteroidetes bacterium]|jgi:AmmeMemoRadiSam system protein B|nr:AmmeMemoRadiSam system protein B [Bacteroidota bacterium]
MCLFTQDEIGNRVKRASEKNPTSSHPTRILFAPTSLNHYTVDQFAYSYSALLGERFDTIVIAETHPGTHEKRLPMPSHNSFSTLFGDVPVNDTLRNELCDEDDDFFIDDEAFSKNLSLFNQLPFLQTVLSDFSVLSLQITDESSAIVKELAAALEEILASRNALLVFCCDICHLSNEKFDKILSQYDQDNMSGLLNSMNSEDVNMTGKGAFFTGLFIAAKWKLKLQFMGQNDPGSPVSGYADVIHQPIFG